MSCAAGKRIERKGMKSLGHTYWVIPDMYMKSGSPEGKVPSHESVSILNTGEEAVSVQVTLLLGEPKELPAFKVEPCESMQLRMDQLGPSGIEIPRDRPYSAIITAGKPVVVEYARLNWIDGYYQSFGLIPYGES